MNDRDDKNSRSGGRVKGLSHFRTYGTDFDVGSEIALPCKFHGTNESCRESVRCGATTISEGFQKHANRDPRRVNREVCTLARGEIHVYERPNSGNKSSTRSTVVVLASLVYVIQVKQSVQRVSTFGGSSSTRVVGSTFVGLVTDALIILNLYSAKTNGGIKKRSIKHYFFVVLLRTPYSIHNDNCFLGLNANKRYF